MVRKITSRFGEFYSDSKSSAEKVNISIVESEKHACRKNIWQTRNIIYYFLKILLKWNIVAYWIASKNTFQKRWSDVDVSRQS